MLTSTCCHVLPVAGAVAMEERRQDPREGERARDGVGERRASLHRWPVRLAGDAHQPGRGLHDVVVRTRA